MSALSVEDLDPTSDIEQPFTLFCLNTFTGSHEPHPKFTSALAYLFAIYSLDIHNHDRHDIDAYQSRFMPLWNYRNLCASFQPNFEDETPPQCGVKVKDLNRFLLYHDMHWKEEEEFVDETDENDYKEEMDVNNPEYAAIFCRSNPNLFFSAWDLLLFISWKAFHQMFVDLAQHSPVQVWNHLFSQKFNGWLNLCEEEYSPCELALAARGLCLNCEQSVLTQLTRISLKCATCALQESDRDEQYDALFDLN